MIINVGVNVGDGNAKGYVGEFLKDFSFDKSLLSHPNLQGDGIINSMGMLRAAVMKGGQGNKMGIVLRKFVELKSSLERELKVKNIDPIQYIIELYYGNEALALETIFNRFKSKGLDYSDRSGLEKVLKRFGWKLKDPEERQETKKVGIMHPSEAIESSKRKSEECRIKFLNWMIINLIETEDPYFDVKYLKSLPSATKKCNYLLKTFYSCELSSFKGTGLGSRTIVRYLQPILDDLTSRLKLDKITITMSGLGDYLKKN